MAEIQFRQAVRDALDEEMARDERVIFFGEDVAIAGGVFNATPGLYEKYGKKRVFDTPISELALSGAAFGSAVCGLRPVIEIMFADFLALAMDSLVNQSAKYWYISNQQGSVPLVVRSACGAGGRFGAIHSQIPVSWFMGVAGLKVVAPSTAADAKGMLKAAIRDDNPVLFLEHKRLYSVKGETPDGDVVVPLGKAAVVREGRDLTIVSAMQSVRDCLEAAEILAPRGIEVEVIDLRSFRPLDSETILESVRRTSNLLVVEEGPATGGWSSQVLGIVAENALDQLENAWRLTTPDSPIPYSPPLEDAFLPSAEAIVNAVLSRL